MGCLRVARPRRHRDAQKPQRFRPGAAILERRSDRDVDGDTGREGNRPLLAGAVAPPDPVPHPDRIYQNSLTVAWTVARFTWPGGTVEWIMSPVAPCIRIALRPSGRTVSWEWVETVGSAWALLRGLVHSLCGHRWQQRKTARPSVVPGKAGSQRLLPMRFGWVRLGVQAKEGADAPDRLEMNGADLGERALA